MTRLRLVGLLAAVSMSLLLVAGAGAQKDEKALRENATALTRDGNHKEAYDVFAKLALDPADDPGQVSSDLTNAIECLRELGRVDEFDEFIEKVIAAHQDNWRLLATAAERYMNIAERYRTIDEHNGFIIAGKFVRGHHRGGTGKPAYAYERDRVRALQLLVQAVDKSKQEKDANGVSDVYWQLAQALLGNRGFDEAWRLQYLSDLTKLPDYEEGYYYYRGQARGAPVNEDGRPVYYSIPKSWEDARSDGERWRWALSQVVEHAPHREQQVQFHFASFLRNQFGVQTLAQHRWFFGALRHEDDARKDESGTYALHTLGENETIARLANGIKRFELPDEFNFIRIFKDVAASDKGHHVSALDALAKVFENRRQYEKAAHYWRRGLKFSDSEWRQKRLHQIVDNWGMFETVMTQPAGQGATVEFRFRNGTDVHFEAYEINVRKLLDDVKRYLKSNPRKLTRERMNIANIGYRLVEHNQRQYIGEKVAEWRLELEPRAHHFDKRITVATPLRQAGAYLLVAKMDDGNTSRIVLWVADTAIVKKPLDEKTYLFVADAVTGRPIPKANVEFFGYDQERVDNKITRGSHYVVHTANFAEFTDADGQLNVKLERKYQWVIIATTPEGRLAYLGFTGVWGRRRRDREYNQTKVFVITDRPVYRPDQTVKFKFWVNQAKYDQEGKSAFAGRQFTTKVTNPRGETIFEKSFTADEYGGFHGEFALEKEATLGVYNIHIPSMGGGNFRVEEYKKPEFEVKIEAPTEPVMLGDKITAKIEAKYYFGAPVTEAKVKYKVLRSSYTAVWYPMGYWDWFYGPGYWWYAYDYVWYPGWKEWGCVRPAPWWWYRPQPPPELVAEVEVPIGEDGVVNVEIDTSVAKAVQGDVDHRYEITAEVTDLSRRTIVGQGTVLVARKPFKVYAWVDRGHYRVGDVVRAGFNAQTLDKKPVKGKGLLRLLSITYDKERRPIETEVQKWRLDTNDEGRAEIQMKASRSGQYRLDYTVTDSKGHAIEGGYVFCIRGAGFDGRQFRFNEIELVTDRREYKPGDSVNLMINTDRAGSTVVLFLRPANGVYLPPKILRLDGKSVVEQIEVVKKDMPNFFVEAFTVSDGKVYTETREVIVPPESRVLEVEVKPSSNEYKPGEKAKVKIRVTDANGKPYAGSTVVSIYDKAVEYISGGSNVPEIKAFFWKWRRRHQPHRESSLDKRSRNLLRSKETAMQFPGVFGYLVADELTDMNGMKYDLGHGGFGGGGYGGGGPEGMRLLKSAARMSSVSEEAFEGMAADYAAAPSAGPGIVQPAVQPTVRTKFADTALWVAALNTNEAGEAEVELTMPENLTTWKARVWAMGAGTRVGEGEAEVVTTKDLIIRLQAPRFFVQKDEVVLSANVHNYLPTAKSVQVILELEGGTLTHALHLDAMERLEKIMGPDGREIGERIGGGLKHRYTIEPNGEKRVDWRVKVLRPGEAIIRVKALTDEESDAMEMRFPVYVHGMLKTESFSGVIRPEQDSAVIAIRVPAERKPEQSRLEIRYSPTLAGAMVDALPYLADYPYGCTEQALNRFLPAVITQKVLLDMGLDLKAIQQKRTNLNAQEIGDDIERAKQWKRFPRNPVFDEDLLNEMVKAGVNRLASMQCSDGGWGWFSGWGERSYPHTTAVVVHGLQIARENDVAIIPGVLERGVEWLKRYQAEEITKLNNAQKDPKKKPWNEYGDNLDALVYMVLVDEKMDNQEMRDFLYRDRNKLAVYAKAMFGMALHRVGDVEKRDMLIRNIEQYLVQDDENQTAYLRLDNAWRWYWYGSEYEAQAYYLKLLAATDPKSRKASRLGKYLVNNRKHATYWNSTRDTAVCIEAFADYIRASGEDRPDMTLTVLLDGRPVKEVRINQENLFTFDNKVVLEGEEVTTGEHTIEFRKSGTGPLYFNAYLTNFTLEDPITRAGLEIKVNRKYYKLVRVDKTTKVEGSRGQALDQKVEKYDRVELANLDMLKSGDLVEIELEIDSKNDYEYILFEDMKAAGFEAVEVRSGYTGNEMGAYVEFRDERTVFFVRALARGKHSVSYRVRAEIPGKFSALPTKASAMYAPELKANSDEIKLSIED